MIALIAHFFFWTYTRKEEEKNTLENFGDAVADSLELGATMGNYPVGC